MSSFLLRILSFAIFESYLRYACQIWGKLKTKKANDIVLFQGKATRITNFENKYTSLKTKTKIKTEITTTKQQAAKNFAKYFDFFQRSPSS